MDVFYNSVFSRALDWAVGFFHEQPYMLAIHAALVRGTAPEFAFPYNTDRHGFLRRHAAPLRTAQEGS